MPVKVSLSIFLFPQNLLTIFVQKIRIFYNGLSVCNIDSNKETCAVKDLVDGYYLPICKD